MKASDITFHSVLNGPNQYVIPVFQRYYSWDKDNWEQLWTDLTELLEPENANRAHFMGSLVLVPQQPMLPDKVPAYQVIDGQQRMITLSLLLCAIRDVAKDSQPELSEEVTQTLLIHPFKKDRERFRVYPRQRDREHYISAIEGQALPVGRIRDALDYFRDKVRGLSESDTQCDLQTFLELLRSRLDFVYITLEGENPYRIFRSLNSTGVDLSEADLIRNFVFMHVPVEEQDNFDDTAWKPLERHFEDSLGILNGAVMSSFFRDFLMRAGHYASPTATFDAFDETYGKTQFSPTDLAAELRRHSVMYDFIRGMARHPDTAINDALAKLGQLESSTTYPLLLNLMRQVQDQTMTSNDFVTAVELLSGFIMRRFICGGSSRGYGRWFVAACRDLEETADVNPVTRLQGILLTRGFPDDERFKSSFLRFSLYSSRYGRSVLEALELAHPHKERGDVALAQIEHVMPQTLSQAWKADLGEEASRVHSEWLNSIGNLTLSAYNPEMSNNPFAEKRQEYAKSNIVLTRQLAEHSSWGEAEIAERGRRLAAVASNIWRGSGS